MGRYASFNVKFALSSSLLIAQREIFQDFHKVVNSLISPEVEIEGKSWKMLRCLFSELLRTFLSKNLLILFCDKMMFLLFNKIFKEELKNYEKGKNFCRLLLQAPASSKLFHNLLNFVCSLKFHNFLIFVEFCRISCRLMLSPKLFYDELMNFWLHRLGNQRIG